jgi:non-ribosomal peptide synthase protein (TIGR01720 family)
MIPTRFAPLERLPQLPGGKIDRNSLPEIPTALRENDDDYTAPRSPVERELAAIWADLLRINTVGVNDNFFQSGGDSILSIQMVARAQAAGIGITAKDAFLHQTIAELAEAASSRPATSLRPDEAAGPLTLTPVQHRFLSLGMPDPHHFHQTVLLDLPGDWSSGTVRLGLQSLIDHHDALRLRGRWHEGQWHQEIGQTGEAVQMGELDLSHIASVEQERAIEDIALRLQEQLDLERGPICRCMFFSATSASRPRLLMVVHHFAVDAVSWRILLEDLQHACGNIHGQRKAVMPPKTSSFRTWTERLTQYADAPSVRDEIAYWMAMNTADSGRIPRDFTGGHNLSGSARTIRRHLTCEDTQALIQQVSVNCHLRPNEILLCALARVITRWTGRHYARIDVESHGREPLFDDVDLSRTVGWFTSVFPTVLRGMPSAPTDELLRENKELLRRIPRGGIGYGVLRWLSRDDSTRARLAASPMSDVAFNYLGQLSAPQSRVDVLRLRRTSIGPMQSERQPRPHLLEILAWIEDERLTLDATWSVEFHRDATMEKIANELQSAVRELIRDASHDDALVTAPVDFPLANIDDSELSALSAALERADRSG